MILVVIEKHIKKGKLAHFDTNKWCHAESCITRSHFHVSIASSNQMDMIAAFGPD